jgi:hypothetical protein
MPRITLNVDIGTEDLINAIDRMNYEETLYLIKHIDHRIADWDFTEMVYEAFKKMHEEYISKVSGKDDTQ